MDVLGQVYEQFLGKVIRLSPGRRVTVEEKPEVRKAGGVYYTPTYIVDYIVERTVGKLLEGQRPGPRGGGASKIKIVDPACGSGSFLIGAYQYLLDWHRDWYAANDPEQRKKQGLIYQAQRSEWRLTTQEKKRILTSSIYGVDIDPQAVEVTKLSLLLKVLEGESEQLRQLALFNERVLPDLGNNILCGNALISPDFFDGTQLSFLSEEDHYRVNVFDWTAAFPQVFSENEVGFDAVIGNPPYIRIQRIAHDEADYLFRRYETPVSKTDLSQLFLERALDLVSEKGLVGFICTSQWLATDYGKNMRRLLADGLLRELVDFGSLPVFQGADTYPAVFVLGRNPAKHLQLKRIRDIASLSVQGIEETPTVAVPLESLDEAPWNLGEIDVPSILNRSAREWKPLEAFGKAYIGALTGMDAVFVVDEAKAATLGLERQILFPYAYRGAEVGRFRRTVPMAKVIYPYVEGAKGAPQLIPYRQLRSDFPRIHDHLISHRNALRQRQDSRRLYAAGDDWYRFLRPGSFDYIHPEKFIIKGIDTRATVGLLEGGTVFNGANCPAIILDRLDSHSASYLLGMLNSKVVSYHLRMVCPPKLGGYTRFNASNVTKTPIPVIDFTNPADKARHDQVVSLVERMLTLNERLAAARTGHDRTILQHQIDATDRQIDRLVYELYELTEEEIAIVEGA